MASNHNMEKIVRERPPEPAFVDGSPLLKGSYSLARSLHSGPGAEAETELEHPVAVAALLHEEGFPEAVVAAALLHEVIEETGLGELEIRESFGAEVATLVAQMTEDQMIRGYSNRKAEHRERVRQDRRVAAIYAADKLATTRSLNERGQEPNPQRLEHFRATLVELCQAHPTLPFLPELRAELDRLR